MSTNVLPLSPMKHVLLYCKIKAKFLYFSAKYSCSLQAFQLNVVMGNNKPQLYFFLRLFKKKKSYLIISCPIITCYFHWSCDPALCRTADVSIWKASSVILFQHTYVCKHLQNHLLRAKTFHHQFFVVQHFGSAQFQSDWECSQTTSLKMKGKPKDH